MSFSFKIKIKKHQSLKWLWCFEVNTLRKSLPDDTIKREYAWRLLHDINLLVQDDIVKQWIQENYLKFNDYDTCEICKKLGLLIDDEISKWCFSLLEKNPTIVESDTGLTQKI